MLADKNNERTNWLVINNVVLVVVVVVWEAQHRTKLEFSSFEVQSLVVKHDYTRRIYYKLSADYGSANTDEIELTVSHCYYY
jgi:hypothetical protein